MDRILNIEQRAPFYYDAVKKKKKKFALAETFSYVFQVRHTPGVLLTSHWRHTNSIWRHFECEDNNNNNKKKSWKPSWVAETVNDNITDWIYLTIENVIIVCDICLDFMFYNRQVNFSFWQNNNKKKKNK